MSSILLPALDAEEERLLSERAAENGHSVQTELHLIIQDALRPASKEAKEPSESWVQGLLELGKSVGGVELDIRDRDHARIPDFK